MGCFGAGQNYLGQIALHEKKSTHIALPAVLESTERIKGVYAGMSSTYYLTESGSVLSSGSNSSGNLGRKSESSEHYCTTGKFIKNLTGIIHISPGGSSFCEAVLFLSATGRVFRTGSTIGRGFRGLNDPGSTFEPIEITSMFKAKTSKKVKWITSLLDTSYFITEDNQVYLLGRALNGEDEVTDYDHEKVTPIPCQALNNVDMLCTGFSEQFMLFKKKNGAVYGFGDSVGDSSSHRHSGVVVSRYGAPRGNGLSDNNGSPVLIPSLRNVAPNIVQINTSYCASYAITARGQLWTCGDNDCGQLLNGEKTDTVHTFVAVGKFDFAERSRSNSWREKSERFLFLMDRIRFLDLCFS